MPCAMHSWYLRELYLHNRLIEKDALTVAGEPIDLGAIVQPVTPSPRRMTTLRPGGRPSAP
jgi:poly(3-hydroxyalkanoate) synthetase